MAIDYFHRVIIRGPEGEVKRLRVGLVGESYRRVAGIENRARLPFSFSGLYAMAPDARRVESERPSEAYDIRAWPTVRRSRAQAEIRYQLHTRDRELAPFLRVLSRSVPRLVFNLSTHCLDDNDVVGFRVINGQLRKWLLPQRRRHAHWDCARQKFGLTGADVYDDDAAELYAEDLMRDEALDHWERQSVRGDQPSRPRQWWNRPVARDFMTERELDVIEVSEILRAEAKEQSVRKRLKGRRKRARGI